jgi:hypothetical protein
MGTPHAIRTGNDNWLTTGVAQRPKVVDKLVSRDEHPVLASFFLPHFRPLFGHPLLLGQRNRLQVVAFLDWPSRRKRPHGRDPLYSFTGLRNVLQDCANFGARRLLPHEEHP